MSKPLKRLGLALLAAGIVVLALLAWGRSELYRQIANLDSKGVKISIRHWGVSTIQFDLSIPKHDFILKDLKVHWGIKRLFPLRLGVDWKESFDEIHFDALHWSQVKVALQAIGGQGGSTLGYDVDLQAQGFALHISGASLTITASNQWQTTGSLAVAFGERSLDLHFFEITGSNQNISLQANSQNHCFDSNTEDMHFPTCTLQLLLSRKDDQTLGSFDVKASSTQIDPVLENVSVSGDFKIGDENQLNAVFHGDSKKGEKNNGAHHDLHQDLSLNIANDDEMPDLYRLSLKCPSPCMDLRFGKNTLPLGRVQISAKSDRNLGDSSFNFDIENVDAGFLHNYSTALAPIKFIVRGNGTWPKHKALNGTLLVRESKNNFDIDGTYQYQPDRRNLTAKAKARFSFSPMFQPKSIYNDLKDILDNLLGYTSVETSIRYQDGHLYPLPIKFKIIDLYGQYEGLPFAKLKLDSNWLYDVGRRELSTQGLQSLKLDRLGKELALENSELQFELSKSHALSSRALTSEFAGGKLVVSPFDWVFENPDIKTNIHLKNLDLGKLLEGLQFSSLSGKGQVTGNVPLSYQNDRLKITNARIENMGDGVVRYRNPTVSDIKEKIKTVGDFAGLIQRGQQALAFKALDNFHYQHFLLQGNRDPVQGMDLRLELKGENPDIAGGQKFELNIPISGNVESLLSQTLIESMWERSGWEKQIQKLMKRRKHWQFEQ